MNRPKLKTASVDIRYSSDDGFRTEVGFSHRRASSPEAALIDAIDEIARIATLFGAGDRAIAAVNDAVTRTGAALAAKGSEHAE